jgi:phosphoglycolate phosphatase
MPSLFIFDWDGTLMDSERQIVHCMQTAAADLALVVPDREDVRLIIGLGLPEAILALFPSCSAGLREQIRLAYARHFIAGSGGQSELFPGAMQLLRALRSNNLQVAVATGKSRAGLDRVLSQSGVSSLFHATRCADETASKPDPKMLFEILESLSVPVDEAIMIGDTTYDLEMAASAGMRSIGVAHGVHSVESLEKHSPVAVVRDLIELAPLLASL